MFLMVRRVLAESRFAKWTTPAKICVAKSYTYRITVHNILIYTLLVSYIRIYYNEESRSQYTTAARHATYVKPQL